MVACAPPQGSTYQPDSEAQPANAHHAAVANPQPCHSEAQSTIPSCTSGPDYDKSTRTDVGQGGASLGFHQERKPPHAEQAAAAVAGADVEGSPADPGREVCPPDSSMAQHTTDVKQAVDGVLTAHQAAIQQAVQHWACRLEVCPAGRAAKPRGRRHLSRRQRAHMRHAVEQQNQIDDAAGMHQVPHHRLPALCCSHLVVSFLE